MRSAGEMRDGWRREPARHRLSRPGPGRRARDLANMQMWRGRERLRDMDEKVEHASASPASPEAPEVEYTFSPGMLARLATLNVALAFTSYQSGFLYFLGRYQGGAHLHRTAIGRPMGLARSESGGLALATEAEIMRFENALRPD